MGLIDEISSCRMTLSESGKAPEGRGAPAKRVKGNCTNEEILPGIDEGKAKYKLAPAGRHLPDSPGTPDCPDNPDAKVILPVSQEGQITIIIL